MATVSTHLLNGLDGSHAGGVAVRLANLSSGSTLFTSRTDPGGRLVEKVDIADADPADRYELVFVTEPYWAARSAPGDAVQIMEAVVLRLVMPDPAARYHLPLILSPNACSVWWSAPENEFGNG